MGSISSFILKLNISLILLNIGLNGTEMSFNLRISPPGHQLSRTCHGHGRSVSGNAKNMTWKNNVFNSRNFHDK